ALKGHCALLMGSDPDQSARAFASELAIFDQLSADPGEILPQSDLVILATPVCTIIDLIHEFSNLHPGCAVVLDIGSTKSEITKAMGALPVRFDPIGGHPMCGKTSTSIANADPSIFLGATFALTPLPRTSQNAIALAEQLVYQIGSRPLRLPADLHDRWVAATSHLPYLLANALVSITSDDVVDLIGPGFRSATRLADSSPTMMLDILKTNRENILRVLSLYQSQLKRLAETLQGGSQDELHQVLDYGFTRYTELLGE
ncbi:MAG: prephenate dehydrogenase/arogenate dehydrogenase family protein, partial [Anaerolineales bacterium]|nr:prephenate dehydrogenase/arogenate dehydrogenase family protein [Anaerolineales bacterium]